MHAIVEHRRSCRNDRGTAHPLAKDVRDVLKDLDGAMPQWRLVAENDMLHPRVRRRENRSGRRKPNRWKW